MTVNEIKAYVNPLKLVHECIATEADTRLIFLLYRPMGASRLLFRTSYYTDPPYSGALVPRSSSTVREVAQEHRLR